MATIHNTRTYFQSQTVVLDKIYKNTGTENPLRYPMILNSYEGDKDRSFWQAMSIVGFGTLARKDEGQAAALDFSKEGIRSAYPWVSYALRYQVTPEAALEDYKKLIPQLPKMLRYSSDQTKEFLFSNILNLAFLNAASGGYNVADGQALISNSHPLTGEPGVTYSNNLGSVALTVETLQAAYNMMLVSVDDRGLAASYTPKQLVYPIGLHQTAVEVLKSFYYPYSNENRINVVADSIEPMAYRYLTSNAAGPFQWFVLAGKGELGKDAHSLFANIKFDKQRSWVDPITENLNQQTEFRASWGAVSGRGIIGSQGA